VPGAAAGFSGGPQRVRAAGIPIHPAQGHERGERRRDVPLLHAAAGRRGRRRAARVVRGGTRGNAGAGGRAQCDQGVWGVQLGSPGEAAAGRAAPCDNMTECSR